MGYSRWSLPPIMQDLDSWWLKRSKGQPLALIVACYVLITLGSIDLGRALYQAIH